MILAGDPASLRTPDQKRIHAIRVSGGEETRHRAALRNAEYIGAFNPDVIHHGPNIIGALFERGHSYRAIGQTSAAFIKANEPAELAEALKEEGALRYFPIQIQVRHGARRPDNIEWSVTCNLIGDADIAAAGVLCSGQHQSN